MKKKRIHRVYEQEFRDRAVEMVIHSGKSQAQVARELGVSGYTLQRGRASLKGAATKQITAKAPEPC